MIDKRQAERLHRQLRNRICERIYRGEYRDGENLPPERVLAQSLDISRVTVRRALAQLAEEGVIVRLQGSGNRVRLPVSGYPGTMDIVAVLAHARNNFFASFIDCFAGTAEASDTLVLFKQTLPGERLEDSLFRLYQKNIRNALIWPEDQAVDGEAIRRLRGLGMNMVFFDASASPYADAVLLDNAAAITALCGLYGPSAAGETQQLAYVGWDSTVMQSVREREQAFVRQAPGARAPLRIAWGERARLDALAVDVVDQLALWPEPPRAVVCGDGEIGIAVRHALLARGWPAIAVASPDDMPQAAALSISVYRQDFARMAQQTYACLCAQNQPGWAASTCRLAGELVARG